jgi:ParB-like chromosome segregation protein Spo0J
MKTINVGAEEVAVERLKTHPRNVNQGDFGAIQESIEANGFFGRIVANKRTAHVLVGNHRLMVARQMGYKTVPVEWVDVDAEGELRIMLADNRTARLGHDDESALAALLSELATTDGGLSGTGFDGDDLDEIIGRLAGPSSDDWASAAGAIPDGDKPPFRQMTFTVHEDQFADIESALSRAKASGPFDGPNENSNGNALHRIAEAYHGRG